jgi:hypothetical protein
MAIFRNETITRERIILDENVYENCTLVKCQVVYRGGQVQLNSRTDDCIWVFEGCALNTIKFLQSVGMLPADASQLRVLPNAGTN